MLVVMGIDPGVANTGFGIVRLAGAQMSAIDGGVIDGSGDDTPERRLARIHAALAELIEWHQPRAVALEDVYFGKNVRSAIGVGKKGTVKDVNVAVRVSHPNVSQLSLYLFKGDKYVRLASGVGGAGNDFGAGTADCVGTFTIFDGSAPTFIQTGSAPFNGAFRPSESLATFNRDKTKGTWRLLAFDSAGGTSGLVNCWVLGLKYKKAKK